uniref:Uncharacterized protein n=1 Tax=Rhizophora mucronata TaxID=61149 RepID=A0A2P2KGN6_RHIMU
MSEIWLRLSPSLKLNTMKEASGKWSCSCATMPPKYTLYSSSSSTSVEKQQSKT